MTFEREGLTLPAGCHSSYTEYTTQQQKLTRWMLSRVRELGINPFNEKAATPQGTGTAKSRKAVQRTGKKRFIPKNQPENLPTKLTISQLLTVAVTLANHAVSQVPQPVLDTLDSVISCREKCAQDCLLLIDIPGMAQINARHARVIGTLREIRDLLINSSQIDKARPTGVKEDECEEQEFVTRVATMSLVGLEDAVVDEVVAELHPDPNEWLPDYLKPKVPKREPPISERPLNEFSLLLDDEDEGGGSDSLQMAAWGLLRDMDSLRAQLRTIWEEFRDGPGSISLIEASFATSQAVQIVKGLEADFAAEFDGSCEYVDVVSAMLQLKAPDGDRKIGSLLESSLPDEISNLFMATTWLALKKFGTLVRPDFIPSLKPVDYGSFDPSRDRSTMSSQECKDEDICLLMNHLAVVYSQTLSSGSGHDHPETETLAEHALIHDFPPFINDPQKRISVHLVFQWAIWKDIVLINRSNLDTCLGELHKEAHKILDIARTWVDNCDDKFYNSALMKKQIQLQLIDKIEQWIFEDPLARHCHSSEDILRLDPPRHFLYNPWACGMAKWRIMIYAHRIQLYIINHTQYLSSALQFYHALRQYERIEAWPFLDGLFAICSPLIFAGSDAPKKGDLFFGHIISTGKDLTNLRSLVDQDYVDTGSSTDTIPVDIYCPFLTKLCEDLEFELTDQIVTELISQTTTGPTAHHGTKHCDPCSLLVAVTDKVHEDLEQTAAGIMTDLFGIQRLAITMLDRWHSRTSTILRNYFGAGYLEEDSQLPFVVSYLFVALDDPHTIAAETPESTRILVEEAVRTIQELKDVVGNDRACLGALGR